jgi:hypothetical protein|tara:strand:+ start:8314 stop:8463 length:150 start_codon:yes stop_codon:yes gene_type:complete
MALNSPSQIFNQILFLKSIYEVFMRGVLTTYPPFKTQKKAQFYNWAFLK